MPAPQRHQQAPKMTYVTKDTALLLCSHDAPVWSWRQHQRYGLHPVSPRGPGALYADAGKYEPDAPDGSGRKTSLREFLYPSNTKDCGAWRWLPMSSKIHCACQPTRTRSYLKPDILEHLDMSTEETKIAPVWEYKIKHERSRIMAFIRLI